MAHVMRVDTRNGWDVLVARGNDNNVGYKPVCGHRHIRLPPLYAADMFTRWCLTAYNAVSTSFCVQIFSMTRER